MLTEQWVLFLSSHIHMITNTHTWQLLSTDSSNLTFSDQVYWSTLEQKCIGSVEYFKRSGWGKGATFSISSPEFLRLYRDLQHLSHTCFSNLWAPAALHDDIIDNNTTLRSRQLFTGSVFFNWKLLLWFRGSLQWTCEKTCPLEGSYQDAEV